MVNKKRNTTEHTVVGAKPEIKGQKKDSVLWKEKIFQNQQLNFQENM